jgi:membrane protein implicated in regulation of membrane protease activity
VTRFAKRIALVLGLILVALAMSASDAVPTWVIAALGLTGGALVWLGGGLEHT